MKAEIKNGHLIITLPLVVPARPSASGKTLIVASTNGNVKTDMKVDGKFVTLGLNAYIAKD